MEEQVILDYLTKYGGNALTGVLILAVWLVGRSINSNVGNHIHTVLDELLTEVRGMNKRLEDIWDELKRRPG